MIDGANSRLRRFGSCTTYIYSPINFDRRVCGLSATDLPRNLPVPLAVVWNSALVSIYRQKHCGSTNPGAVLAQYIEGEKHGSDLRPRCDDHCLGLWRYYGKDH
jgi:hypothetical protein